MKIFIILTTLTIAVISCARQSYSTNGETIFRSGKNADGQSLLDKNNSSIRIFKSCQGCHGKSGDRMRSCNIQWSHLSDATKMEVPYNDSLFARFIDKDIKSDGTAAQTGVNWKMCLKEKSDLVQFLKTL
jgi:hypothetical protein